MHNLYIIILVNINMIQWNAPEKYTKIGKLTNTSHSKNTNQMIFFVNLSGLEEGEQFRIIAVII